MPNTEQRMTISGVNAGLLKIDAQKSLTRLHRYATMDTGELYVALADEAGFYRDDVDRPAGPCEVWVMSGMQPISFHGMECDAALASACVLVMGLKIAKAFGGAAPSGVTHGRPWLDDLALVMLRANRNDGSAPGSVPLSRALYNRAMQHGVDMNIFKVYDDCEEHF